MKTSASRAFTLTEVLLALGLFAVAVGGILALFPAAHRSERETAEETRATLIASGILDALLIPGSANDRLRLITSLKTQEGTQEGKDIPVWTELPAGIPLKRSVLYGSSCEPLGLLEEGREETIANNPHAAAVAVLQLQHSSLPGLWSAEVNVASPVSAPPENRRVRRFVRLLYLSPSPGR